MFNKKNQGKLIKRSTCLTLQVLCEQAVPIRNRVRSGVDLFAAQELLTRPNSVAHSSVLCEERDFFPSNPVCSATGIAEATG